MRNRLTHGLGWRGHWLDMLGGSAGKVNEAPGLPAPKMDRGRKIAMTPTMMDYGARGGIANYVNCGILRLGRRRNFGIRRGPDNLRVPTQPPQCPVTPWVSSN
jgi:hypothetical protein